MERRYFYKQRTYLDIWDCQVCDTLQAEKPRWFWCCFLVVLLPLFLRTGLSLMEMAVEELPCACAPWGGWGRTCTHTRTHSAEPTRAQNIKDARGWLYVLVLACQACWWSLLAGPWKVPPVVNGCFYAWMWAPGVCVWLPGWSHRLSTSFFICL